MSDFRRRMMTLPVRAASGGESWKEDSWWDIRSIVQNPENRMEKYPYRTIQLLISYSNSDTFSGAQAYSTSDGKFYETEEEVVHVWDMDMDKPCMEDGVETYGTRWVISHYASQEGALNAVLQSVLYYIADGYVVTSGTFRDSRVLKSVECINGASMNTSVDQNVFYGCPYLEKFPMEVYSMPNNLFYNCYGVRKVPELIKTNPWSYATRTQVKRIRFADSVSDITMAYMDNMPFLGRIDTGVVSDKLSLAGTAMSRNSLLSLLALLPEISDAKTFKIGENNISKLTEEEIQTVTEKGWTLA